MRAAAPWELSAGLLAMSLAMLFCRQQLDINPPVIAESGPAALLVNWPIAELQKQVLKAVFWSAVGHRKLHRLLDGAAGAAAGAPRPAGAVGKGGTWARADGASARLAI